MNRAELLTSAAEGSCIIALFGYFFYRSRIITLLLIPAIFPYLLHKAKRIRDKKRKELLMQFKEMLGSVTGSIQAGYSIENAFLEADRDMRQLFGPDAEIVKELGIIRKGIENNHDIILMLRQFALRSGVEEIESFAGILDYGRRSGGNITANITAFVRVIEEKAGVLLEIETMVSARRFEQKIMSIIPFGIIFYVELGNKGFFNILYHNLPGNLIMTAALVIYLLSVYLSEKITDIAI